MESTLRLTIPLAMSGTNLCMYRIQYDTQRYTSQCAGDRNHCVELKQSYN